MTINGNPSVLLVATYLNGSQSIAFLIYLSFTNNDCTFSILYLRKPNYHQNLHLRTLTRREVAAAEKVLIYRTITPSIHFIISFLWWFLPEINRRQYIPINHVNIVNMISTTASNLSHKNDLFSEVWSVQNILFGKIQPFKEFFATVIL